MIKPRRTANTYGGETERGPRRHTNHNRIDSLVPYAQEAMLAAAVAKAGRTAKLTQFTVPPTRAPLPVGGIEGYTHCGFDKTQTLAAWNALCGWVEQGRKPDATLR